MTTDVRQMWRGGCIAFGSDLDDERCAMFEGRADLVPDGQPVERLRLD